MSSWISLVVFLSTSVLVMLVFAVLNRDNLRIAARVQRLAGAPSSSRSPLEGLREALARLPIAGALLGESAARQTHLRQRFARAGIYSSSAPSLFLAAKLVLAVAGAAVALGVGAAYLLAPSRMLMACAILSAVGVLTPGLWLDRRIARWQGALRRGLPDAMDMLVLCLEGGTTLTAALQYVGGELRLAHPELAGELSIVEHEMMVGKTTGEAMQMFGQRCDLEEVRTLASVLLQNERYGISVAKALRIHSDTMRQQRQQRAEEMAQKAAVKILFPTLLCIFPAIFIVILGPAAFRIMTVFSGTK